MIRAACLDHGSDIVCERDGTETDGWRFPHPGVIPQGAVPARRCAGCARLVVREKRTEGPGRGLPVAYWNQRFGLPWDPWCPPCYRELVPKAERLGRRLPVPRRSGPVKGETAP